MEAARPGGRKKKKAETPTRRRQKSPLQLWCQKFGVFVCLGVFFMFGTITVAVASSYTVESSEITSEQCKVETVTKSSCTYTRNGRSFPGKQFQYDSSVAKCGTTKLKLLQDCASSPTQMYTQNQVVSCFVPDCDRAKWYIKQLSINTAIVFFVIAGCFYAAFVGYGAHLYKNRHKRKEAREAAAAAAAQEAEAEKPLFLHGNTSQEQTKPQSGPLFKLGNSHARNIAIAAEQSNLRAQVLARQTGAPSEAETRAGPGALDSAQTGSGAKYAVKDEMGTEFPPFAPAATSMK